MNVYVVCSINKPESVTVLSTFAWNSIPDSLIDDSSNLSILFYLHNDCIQGHLQLTSYIRKHAYHLAPLIF